MEELKTIKCVECGEDFCTTDPDATVCRWANCPSVEKGYGAY